MRSRLQSPAESPRPVAASGGTDLNSLIAGLLADCGATHYRCDTLPVAAGAEEEWWMLLRWLLQPLRQEGGLEPRYVHVQCIEEKTGRDSSYLLSVRCNGLGAFTRAFAFANPQLAGIAERLGVTLAAPAAADTHCIFILQFAGKNPIHAHP